MSATTPTGRPATAALTPRQITRRRRAEAARRSWREFRTHRSGVLGLGILSFFVLVAVLAPVLADPAGLEVTQATGGVLEPPSLEFPLGTDDNGRSVLTLLIWGSRVSLFVGLTATAISMVLGTLVGIAGGFFTGWPAAVLYRVTEWFLVLPFLPLAIVLATVLGRGLLVVAFVIGVTSWPGTAMLIRSQTLSVKERPYLERARVLGAGRWHQMSRHVLPNVMPMVFANTTLTVALAILAETTLSFLGLGLRAPITSWGVLLTEAQNINAVALYPWLLWPVVPVILVVLAYNFFGDGLRDAADPYK